MQYIEVWKDLLLDKNTWNSAETSNCHKVFDPKKTNAQSINEGMFTSVCGENELNSFDELNENDLQFSIITQNS